jgi:hypothetical protein
MVLTMEKFSGGEMAFVSASFGEIFPTRPLTRRQHFNCGNLSRKVHAKKVQALIIMEVCFKYFSAPAEAEVPVHFPSALQADRYSAQAHHAVKSRTVKNCISQSKNIKCEGCSLLTSSGGSFSTGRRPVRTT